jgi:fumarate reductase subunit D
VPASEAKVTNGLILLALIALLGAFVWTRMSRRLGAGVTWRTWVTTVTVLVLLILALWAYNTHR